ncbi:NEW3 domain-containing protein [Chloroflexota bacterium]
MRSGKKVLWLFLLIAALLACLGSPTTLIAQEAKVDLSLRMLPEYRYKEVIPGDDNALFMEVRNNGDKEITNIRFDSDKPEGWVVDFKPDSIDYLSAGSSQMIDVNVIPSLEASRGEYDLAFIAEADETRTATSTMLRVETGYSFWLWVGFGVAALAIMGFIFIFLRFGRQ